MPGGVNIYPSIPTPQMGQLVWFIDEQNATGLASDANDGLTAATPLLHDSERVRRMGNFPTWSGAYHLRYLSDTNGSIFLSGDRTNAVIYVHGSATDNVGQSVLYTGTIDAITALNRNAAAGGQPILVTSNGLPVSWTASGLVRGRLRRTSDNATSWVAKDLGAKQCRTWEWTAAGVYGATFSGGTAAAVPALNDPIVVEQLTKIKGVVLNLYGRTQTNFNGVVFDSVDIGGSGIFQSTCPVSVVVQGSVLRNTSTLDSFFQQLSLNSARLCPAPGAGPLAVMPRAVINKCTGGGIDSDGTAQCTAQVQALVAGSFSRYMTQDLRLVLMALPGTDVGGTWAIAQLGCFDNPSGDTITLKSPQAFFLSGAAAVLWGSGNTGFSIGHRFGSSWMYTVGPLAVGTNLNIVSATGDVAFGNQRQQCRAFDDTVGTYTALRNLTFANILATIATTGFSAVAGFPQFTDPVSGCGISMTA